MEPIHQLIAVSHACQEAGKRFGKTSQVNNLVCLQVPNKMELVSVMDHLAINGILFESFYEDDRDEGLVSIATEYIVSKKQRNLFEDYKLLWQEK